MKYSPLFISLEGILISTFTKRILYLLIPFIFLIIAISQVQVKINERETAVHNLNLEISRLELENVELSKEIAILHENNNALMEKNYSLAKKLRSEETSRSKTLRSTRMIATAYTASVEECGKSDGITASGKKVTPNRTIAASKDIPFGTKIRITCSSYPSVNGIYVVEDRGGAIKSGKIDIYMTSKDEARKFGRREVICEILN